MSKQWEYDGNELIDLYTTQSMSILNIARMKGVGYKAVRNALLREGAVLRARNTAGLRQLSDETKEKIRMTKVGDKNPNWKAKSVTDHTKDLIRKIHTGRKHSTKTKRQMSRTRIERKLSVGNRNPMRREECVRKWIKSNNISPNKQELKLFGIIESIVPGKYAINTRGEVAIIDGAIPDFVSTTADKDVIELFGDYWHKGEDERIRIKRFDVFGYRTIVVWEKELADVEKLKQKIIEFERKR